MGTAAGTLREDLCNDVMEKHRGREGCRQF